MQDRAATLLLDWYDAHARTLPWRARPGEPAPEPYHVWLSEIMLQQTTVQAVKPYFAEFVTRWPSVDALAMAPHSDVLAAWAGLGYYSRARNLVKCAKIVAERGAFPDDEAALRKLPGIGEYTAAAIAAIAFGKRAVVLDANVERVVARLFAVEEPLPAGRRIIRQYADKITPDHRAGDFAQAMMDLGASICTARSASCLICPLHDICAARRTSDPTRLPVKMPKKAKPLRRGTAFWIERDAAVWLVTRPETGILAGMRSMPDDGWSARSDGDGGVPLQGDWKKGGMVRHSFTHFDLELELAICCDKPPQPDGEGAWHPVAQLDEAGLPTLFRKAARLALS